MFTSDATLLDINALGVELDGQVQIADSIWAIYGHTTYDGEIIVAEYGNAAEASQVLRADSSSPTKGSS